MNPLPSRMKLNELFIYSNGKLLWREDRPPRGKAGEEAGNLTGDGYRVVSIGGVKFLTHRLMWKLLHGDDPEHIDHINGDRQDNRITNLRSVSRLENQRNMKRCSLNKSGVTGVSWDKVNSKWVARIRLEGSYRNLGRFDSLEEAVSVRKQAEVDQDYHPNHGRHIESSSP